MKTKAVKKGKLDFWKLNSQFDALKGLELLGLIRELAPLYDEFKALQSMPRNAARTKAVKAFIAKVLKRISAALEEGAKPVKGKGER